MHICMCVLLMVIYNFKISTCPFTNRSGTHHVFIDEAIIEYEPRKEVYLRDLPANHLVKLKSVQFSFTDYKVFNKLGCYPYERMLIQCVNHYGVDFLHKDI